jgi:hypothetical protein
VEFVDGFTVVARKNNPLRQNGMVHRNLGKIGPVKPLYTINIVDEMVRGGIEFGTGPIIGLSESSILLGRIISEFITHTPFIFSSRYPMAGMVAFMEPHSHAPIQYLNMKALKDVREICIVEDEITTGNTLLNLIQVLLSQLDYLQTIRVVALKMFCSDYRVRQMQEIIAMRGVQLYLTSLYRGEPDKEELLLIESKVSQIESITLFDGFMEAGRGRTDLFLNADSRREFWDKVFVQVPEHLTVIGVSEAIDLAFEISHVLEKRGCNAKLSHMTISPWDLPGWEFDGLRPLFLYYPPTVGGNYVIVYDQMVQYEQVHRLASRLRALDSIVHVIGPGEENQICVFQ